MKFFNLTLTNKQIDAVLVALSEYAQIEYETESGATIARYYDKVRESILRQVEKQEKEGNEK